MSVLNQFMQYINAQPDDRPIDHEGGWCNCAVGDFAVEELGMDKSNSDVFYQCSIYDPLLRELKEEEPMIYDVLNEPFFMAEWALASGIDVPRTYGKLKRVCELLGSRGMAYDE